MVSEGDGHVDLLLRTVSYYDGGMTGMRAISWEELLESMTKREEYNIKHTFGTSLIFEPSDLATCYKTLKRSVKKNCSRNKKTNML